MNLPTWANEVITNYESGAAGCFILHGNINDRMVIPTLETNSAKKTENVKKIKETQQESDKKQLAAAEDKKEGKEEQNETTSRIGGLQDYLLEVMLPKFDVVISYDLGFGIQVERGIKTLNKWPSYDQFSSDLPRDPLAAISLITRYLTYCRNLRLSKIVPPKVAIIIKQAHLVCPQVPGILNNTLNALATFLRGWAENERLQQSGQAAFLLSENLNSLHSLVSNSPRIAQIEIPLPKTAEIASLMQTLRKDCAPALDFYSNLNTPAKQLVGSTLSSIEALLLRTSYQKESLNDDNLIKVKKAMVERDCSGLIDFVQPDRNLNDVIGLEGVKTWLRQDIALWKKEEVDALPMGYLFCGPVGTGKTYLAECLAGEAGVPVITMRNFRDKWVGSTEANLEKIFSLIHALGRCIVFIDEADQALGKRQAGSDDSGVSSRVYSMMAKEMSNTRNRGKVLWVLASSRPDLIEVDLKRPGRIDVKIPLYPCLNDEQSFKLIQSLAKRRKVNLEDSALEELKGELPELLTPGAAEALAVKTFRIRTTSALNDLEALKECLKNYRSPVSESILLEQMRLATEEATDHSMVPEEVEDLLA